MQDIYIYYYKLCIFIYQYNDFLTNYLSKNEYKTSIILIQKSLIQKFDTFKSLFHFTLFFIYILIKEKNSIREKKYLI